MATNTTLQDLRDDLDSRISAAKISGFWTQAFKDGALNDAGELVSDAYAWGFLEKALTTQTRNSQEYYDYPTGANEFTEESIYQLQIAGEDYGGADGRKRLPWEEFQKRKNVGDDGEYVFSNHNGYYFIYPVPADGLEMTIFGLVKWRKLVNTGDKPVTPVGLDNAIVKLALAKCFRKQKKYAEAKAEMIEVMDPQVGILAVLWNKINAKSPGGFVGRTQSSRW